jgi:chemotaxis protein MotB
MVRILKEQNAGLSGKNDDLARLLQECLERGARPPVIIQKTALPPALDQALKDFAAQYPGQVTYDPARGMVKFGSDLLFDLGKTTIRQNATEALGAFAEIVASQAAANFDVIVVGHTDNVPIVRKETKQRHPTNWHLSVHRAISVMSALSKSGVGSSRMGVLGYGEHRPIVSNPTRGGNQANRRVELYLVGKNTVCLSEVIPPLSAAGASESVRVVTSVEGE